MKKKMLIFSCILALLLTACNQSSEEIFSFQDMVTFSSYNFHENLSESDFFAKDLVIIPSEINNTSDDLIDSKAALLVNITENEAKYSKNAFERLYPASLTKLATALVVLKRGELTDTVTVSKNATIMPSSNAKICGFKEGDVITLDDLLHAMLIYSGNDAAKAIAEHLAGTEEQFVQLMNQEVKALGATHSNFVNSHGLHDDNHYSTAYDLYLIFNELVKYDRFLDIISMDSFTAEYKDMIGNEKSKNFSTTNLYLKGQKEFPDRYQLYGGKTGTTQKAGNCLILFSKDDKGSEYISLILKADNETSLYTNMNLLFSTISE